ncbi:MAG: amidohydrolase family protein [Bacteroidota bacterium]|nr:amidohydrolase family protein [Bacteroidota bacterium]
MRLFFGFLLLAVLLPQQAAAQVNSGDEVPEVTRTFALTNARVVQAPGRVMEQATIIVRDGLIAAVGPDIEVPFDAEEIPADSFVVYAGFIDGLSHTGIPEPREQRNRERPDDPGDPPNEEAGIQPDRDVHGLLDPEDKRLAALRNAGFTTVHVVPRGRMLPGTGAIILLGGETANEMVYRARTAMFAQLSPARRMYPGTDMAVMAKLRQLFTEAKRRQHLQNLYSEDPAGLERPPFDPVHNSLLPVLREELPVYFHTQSALDLHRALEVQSELGFPVVLTGLNQSFDAVDKLRQAGHALILTLDLPVIPRTSESYEETPADSVAAPPTDAPEKLPEIADPGYDTNLRVQSQADLEAEKANLEKRREIEHRKYLANAADLASSGLAFGFSTLGVKPADLMGNVRLMIDNGLSEDAALAALTTTAADILGVAASMGTVEVGKMANMVVADGPVFEEKSKIKYVFVDGKRFEVEQPARSGRQGRGDQADLSPAGRWSFTVSSEDGNVGGTITIDGSATNWSGTITNDLTDETADLTNIRLDGRSLSFEFSLPELGTISVSVVVSEDSFDGDVTVEGIGAMPISGSRTSGPESYHP